MAILSLGPQNENIEITKSAPILRSELSFKNFPKFEDAIIKSRHS